MINAEARQRIEAAIAAAEKESRAELVAVLTRRASEYRSTGLALATVGAFLAGLIAWGCLPWSETSEVLLAEFGIFLILLALLELTPLGDRLTPASVTSAAARRLARATFLEQGLAATPERNAVMFFVSAAERHVEIIADQAINAKVSQPEWQAIINDFTAKVRAGQVEEGYLSAIAALGRVLAQHFPSTGERPNAVANRLIEL